MGILRRVALEPAGRGAPRLALGAALVLGAALLAGCERDRPDQAPPAPPAVSQTAVALAPSGGASSDAASPDAAAPTPGGTAAPGAAELAGTWEGRYDAKKGSVDALPKVKDKTHGDDDGKSSSGPGTVKLTVSPDGEIKGKASGALGNATLSGRAEGNMIRVSVFPDDPLANAAMTGVLIGLLKDGTLRAELRVAGPDAKVVRESLVELKRNK